MRVVPVRAMEYPNTLDCFSFMFVELPKVIISHEVKNITLPNVKGVEPLEEFP